MQIHVEEWSGRAPGPSCERIYAGQLTGSVVRAAVSPERCAVLAEALPGGLERFEVLPGNRPMHALGLMLSPTALDPRGPELEAYFAAAARAEPEWSALAGDLFSEVEAQLEVLAGVPVGRPRSAGGQPYARATCRVVPPGYGVPAHCDSYPPAPAWEELFALTDRSTQLSWYVPLSVPERGGELVIFPIGGDGELTPEARRAAAVVALAPGDLIVFDGARFVHEVRVNEEGPPRRTLGGFAGFSPDHDRLLYWS